jgi:hypothetical protein
MSASAKRAGMRPDEAGLTACEDTVRVYHFSVQRFNPFRRFGAEEENPYLWIEPFPRGGFWREQNRARERSLWEKI